MAELINVVRRDDGCVDAVWKFKCSHEKRYFAGNAFLARLNIVMPTINVCPDCLEKICAGVPIETLGITRDMIFEEVVFELPSYEENCRLAAEDEARMDRENPIQPLKPGEYFCPF